MTVFIQTSAISRHLVNIAVVILAVSQPVLAGIPITDIANFNNANGFNPMGQLVFDSAGNLYGTTRGGGLYGQGTVFKLTRTSTGAWTLTTLFSFNGTNGALPEGGVVFDSQGNLYGTTSTSGAYNCGTIFKLTFPIWRHKTLVNFTCRHGNNPRNSLILDTVGNFYGTTLYGGAYGSGTLFKLSPPSPSKPSWAFSSLVNFKSATTGEAPYGKLVHDKAWNIYGTTANGGANGRGTIFKLSPPIASRLSWKITTLVNFDSQYGTPYSGLTLDASGNFYGTATSGGAYNNGVAFKLTPPTTGSTKWTITKITNFRFINGSNYISGLVFDRAKNLYGISTTGGIDNEGLLFKLSSPAIGRTAWPQSILVNFNSKDGSGPVTDLVYRAGSLYGTTSSGGSNIYGTVFKVTPP